MNKKIILSGSIGASIILVLVSFTSVVGFQTTQSTIETSSPLFSTRIAEANRENKHFNSNYVGRGKEPGVDLPKLREGNTIIGKLMSLLTEKKSLILEKLKELKEIGLDKAVLQQLVENQGAMPNSSELATHPFTYCPSCPQTVLPKCIVPILIFILAAIFFSGVTLLFRCANLG